MVKKKTKFPKNYICEHGYNYIECETCKSEDDIKKHRLSFYVNNFITSHRIDNEKIYEENKRNVPEPFSPEKSSTTMEIDY